MMRRKALKAKLAKPFQKSLNSLNKLTPNSISVNAPNSVSTRITSRNASLAPSSIGWNKSKSASCTDWTNGMMMPSNICDVSSSNAAGISVKKIHNAPECNPGGVRYLVADKNHRIHQFADSRRYQRLQKARE